MFERMRKEIHGIANREILSNENILIESRMEAYAKQIYSIMKRFPELNFEGNCWRNANSSAKRFHDDSSWFEVATACWNTAALFSELALYKIANPEGNAEDEAIKLSCSLFQKGNFYRSL